MKKLILLFAAAIFLFFPAILTLVFAQENNNISFHLSVTKKTAEGDAVFNYTVDKVDLIVPVGIYDPNKVYASETITGQIDEFPITTQNGLGKHESTYQLSGFYGIEVKEQKTVGWRIKSINCNSNNEQFFQYVFGDTVTIYNVADGDEINCVFINERIKNPVLIVPGLLGSEIKNQSELLWADTERMFWSSDDNFLDLLSFPSDLVPMNSLSVGNVIRDVNFMGIIKDYSQKLIDQLTSSNVGYEINKTLFTFPYDWRYGASGSYPEGDTNSDLLEGRIQEIRDQTGADKVDIIAHSLGGLVAKKYVMENDEPHIGKLIFVGTPNLGSPIAAKSLLMGHNFDIAVLSSDKIKEISRNMPAAYDLLPGSHYRETITSYIKFAEERAGGGFAARNLSFAESQAFLVSQGANSEAQNQANDLRNISGLDDFDVRTKGVDAYKITGCASSMPMMIRANKSLAGNITFEPYSYISSDNTVPFGSSDSIQAENGKSFYAIKARHGAMMGEDGIKQTIANILSGSKLPVRNSVINKDQLINNPYACALNGVMVRIYSPLDIEITDQDGKRLGLDENNNPQNDIPGASFDIVDGHKFVYLSTGSNEQYEIDLRGTDSGTFTLETQNIKNDVEGNSHVFSDIAVSPSLKANLSFDADGTILKLDNNGDGEVDEVLLRSDVEPDVVAPVVIVSSPENGKTYANNQIINVAYRATDNISGSDKIKTQVYLDNATTTANSIDLAFQKTGGHILRIVVQDEAANIRQQEVAFIASANIVSMISNVTRYSGLGLIKKPETTFLLAQLKILLPQLAALEKLRANNKLSVKAKNAAISVLGLTINKQIDIIIKEIKRTTGKLVDNNASALLIDGLAYIRIK